LTAFEYPQHQRDAMDDLPAAPGVYIFHGDSEILPLYIGKICHACLFRFQHQGILTAMTNQVTDSVLSLKVPEGYTFADLKVRRCDDDAIDLDMDLFKLICDINGLSFDKVLLNPGPVVTSILTIWYKSHLAQGGAPDALMEELKSQGPRLN
jgi:hypothetical protein